MVPLQGLAEARPGEEAQGVVQVEPAGLTVGPGAQLQDGDDSTEVVEAGVGLSDVQVHGFSVTMDYRAWQWASVRPDFLSFSELADSFSLAGNFGGDISFVVWCLSDSVLGLHK